MKWNKILGMLNKNNRNQSKTIEYPSLDLIFNLTLEQINNQQERLVALDTKANFTLGAATGLISLALVLESFLLSSHTQTDCSTIIPQFINALPPLLQRTLPLIPLLSAYLVAMAMGLYSYKLRKLIRVPRPRMLFTNFLEKSEDYTKEKVLQAMIEALESNEDKLQEKAKLINLAFLVLALEAFLLVLLLFYQVIC